MDSAYIKLAQTAPEAFGAVYRLADGESAVVRGLKCALAVEGICTDTPADPWEPLGEGAKAEVRRVLAAVRS